MFYVMFLGWNIVMLDGYFLLVVCILGLVEGLTEFMPISSALHVVFVGNFLEFTDDDTMKFLLNVVLQLGAICSIVVIFWRRFSVFFRVICVDFNKKSYLCCWHIIFGIFPMVFFGLFFYENIRSVFNIQYMFYSSIVGSCLLLLAEWYTRQFYVFNNSVSDINNVSYFQAFLIGCFQCLSLFPGFSRSGATISGGLFVGMSRSVAAVFSFLLAVPIILCATVLVVYKNFHFFSLEYLPMFFFGFISAFIVSLFTVKLFMRVIQRVSFVPFSIYRFILAGLMYFFDFVKF